MRALSFVNQRFFLGAAATAVLWLSASRGVAAPPVAVVVVEVTPGPLDPGRVRAAVGRELGMTAVAPEDPRATVASGRLAIAARGSDKTLTVTFRTAEGVTTRTVGLPDAQQAAESSAVLLAGNVARDEASDLLRGLAKGPTRGARAPAAPPSAPSPASPASPASPPSPPQIAALALLDEEIGAYEKGARDYRDTVTSIIKLHYESKKKAILSGLDHELATETAELKRARAVAIARLEAFIEGHRGPGAAAVAPDAMYRLAALYEERARAEDTGLDDAIRLYERILREYPAYRELAGVHYFLGHALSDAGRVAESQQAWRSLVCHNHYDYPTTRPMPQDADEAHWTEWRRRHDGPRTISKKDPETVYVEVYPSDCMAVAQPSLQPGEEPRYLAEVWWQIGNWEFDQLDFASGVTKRDPASVWGYNRAASAYAHALTYRKPQIYGISLYKYAWTLFKQQRYELATKELVKLLVFTDEREKITGDHGADFRSEAYTYIAGSLTNADFKGPEDWEPFVARPDILDSEPSPTRAEKKLHVAIDRVKDPALVPQDKPWTIEIYRALALEYRSLNQLANALEVYETMLARWPMDPTAPETQSAIAEVYDQTSLGTPQHEPAAKKALEARGNLARYAGTTPWVDANKDNPAAIHAAERLVRTGLRQAAAQYTSTANAALAAADGSREPARQIELLARAGADYRLAAAAWQGALDHGDSAEAYESGYWCAQAHRNAVRVQMKLAEVAPKTYAPPAPSDIDAALVAAVRARDSNQDDRYLDNAAFFVVDLTDVSRDLAYARHAVEKRDEVAFDAADPRTRHVVSSPIPSVVEQSMRARDEYVRIVPRQRDPQGRALAYGYYVAETYFLYGDWELARRRFEPMWRENCGASPFGFKAWEKLVTMATLQRDEARALALAEAVDPAKGNLSCDSQGEGRYIDPIRIEVSFGRARRRFEETCEAKLGQPCKSPDAAAKKTSWREVAALYERALESGAGRDEAPEAAMNAAYAHQQVGEQDQAIGLYDRVTREYPKSPYLGQAFEALGAMYYARFDYVSAADTYQRESTSAGLEEPRRREAARNAMVLDANLGDRERMLAAYQTLARLHPAAEDKADADYRVAAFDHQPAALVRYVDANRRNPAAARFVVEAAYTLAKTKRAAGEPDHRTWLARTVAAWDDLAAKDRTVAQAPPYVDYAAEAAFTLLDEDIASKLEASAVRPYQGTAQEIFAAYQRNADEAKRWDLELETKVISKFESLEWVPAALARRGAVFDALRSGLYDTTKVRLFDASGDRLVATLRSSGQPKLVDQADELEDTAQRVWREKKERELDGADEVIIRRYATAVAYARKYNVKSAQITRALGRLAFYTDIIGDAKMAAYVTSTPDPTTKGATKLPYSVGMYVKTRPGL